MKLSIVIMISTHITFASTCSCVFFHACVLELRESNPMRVASWKELDLCISSSRVWPNKLPLATSRDLLVRDMCVPADGREIENLLPINRRHITSHAVQAIGRTKAR